MLNQNVNLAGLALTPEEQARMAQAQAAQAAAAAPMDAGSYKGYQNPVSTGEALSKVLQSYVSAKQKDDILNQAKGDDLVSSWNQTKKAMPETEVTQGSPRWSETATAKGAFQKDVDFDKMKTRFTLPNNFLTGG
jgi:hypothetical protein